MAVITQLYDSGGGTWTVPVGVNQVTITAIGGGGGGSSAVGGFGGGGGGLRRIVDMPVAAGEVLVWNAGDAGQAGTGGGYGSDGGDSWVKNYDAATFAVDGIGAGNVTYILAEGGKGGKANGVGGQGYGGTVTNAASITLTSSTVSSGTDAPNSIYSTTSGVSGAANSNPQLSWTVSGLPSGVTVSSYRIHIEDLSTAGKFVHWHLTGINPSVNSIAFGATTLPTGATVQNTGWPTQVSPYVNSVGYGGPAPPSGKHNYRITISAILSGSSSVLVKGLEFYAGTGTIIANQASATYADQFNVVTGTGAASIGGQGGGGSLLGYYSNLNGKAVVIEGGQGGNGGAPDYSPPTESPGCGGGGAAGYTNNFGAQGAYGKNSDGSFLAPSGGGGGGGNASKYGATGGGGVFPAGPGSSGSAGNHSLLSENIAGATQGSGGNPSQGVAGSASTFASNTLQASGGGDYGGGGAGMQSSKGTILAGGGRGAVSFSYTEPIITPNSFSFDQITGATVSTTYESTTTSGGVTSNYVVISGLPAGQSIPITVSGTASGKAISISTYNAGAYTTTFTGLTVQNGSQIRMRCNSSPNSSSSVYMRLQIGSFFADFTIVTASIGGNFPSPLPQFQEINDALISTTYYSNVVQVSGLSAVANVVLSGPTSLRVATSNSNAVDGTGALTGATFGTSATINNGQYLQLRVTSSATANNPSVSNITIGSSSAISWTVTTGTGVDLTPTPFTFTNITNAVTSPQTFYTASRTFGDTEFTANYDVPVSIINFTAGATVSCRATAPSATPGSFGSFPVYVRNGYTLEIRMDAAPTTSTTRFLTVQVGDYSVNPWTITTVSSPDATPNSFSFVNVTNSPPVDLLPLASSNTITLSGFTVPISINCTTPSGVGASGQAPLISVNGDTAVVGPRQINPNDTIRIDMPPSSALGTTLTTTVTAGGVSANFAVTTYATAPDTSNIFGQWYSAPAVIQSGTRKKRKEDGLTIGTVISITKDRSGNWGTLDGTDNSRFPGFLECDGRYLDPKEYNALWKVLGNTYGGDVVETPVTSGGVVTDYTYTGKFRLPNYRNRKLAGVGRVDGNSAGSPSLTIAKGADPDGASSGDIQTPGASGGQWYIDEVDVSGTPPLEQVYDGTPEDTDGIFWSLGNLSTTGYSSVQGQTVYTIAGNMNVSIGPLNETLTPMPGHSHGAVVAQPTEVSGYSILRWGQNASTGWNPGSGTGSTLGSSCSNLAFFAAAVQQSYDQSKTIAPPPAQGYPSSTEYFLNFFNIEYQGQAAFRYTWWQNNFGSTSTHKRNDIPLDNTFGQSLASIAILAGNASATIFNPEGGQITHSHYLQVDTDYGIASNHYGYGNSTGGGATVGITGATSNVTVEFQQNNLGISSNDATFTLSNSKQLIPNVSLDPQKRVSLMNKYSRTKYLIKAF